MNCRTCHNVNLKADSDSSRSMKKMGYARCHLLDKWQYVAGWYVCKKWKAKQ